MIGTSRMYSSLDADAPRLLKNNPGSLIRVLNKVLVTGYGDKEPLNWDIVYTEGNICSYRPKEGSRMCLQIIDEGSTSGKVFAYSWENLFSVNTGLHRVPASSSNRIITHIGSTVPPEANIECPWIIIGDEIGFYLLLKCHTEQNTERNLYNKVSMSYFGNCIVLGEVGFASNYNWAHVTYTDTHTITFTFMRNPRTQAVGAIEMNTISWTTSASANSPNIENAGATTVCSIAGIQGYEPLYTITSNNVYEITLPGLFAPIRPTGNSEYRIGEEWFEQIDKNNKLYCVPVHTFQYGIPEKCRMAFLIGDKFRHVF